MNRKPVVVIGAGPAGMASAIAAAERGLSVTLLDEAPHPGGQIYRVPPGAQSSGETGAGGDTGDQLRRKLRNLSSRIEVWTGTRVWGIFPGRRLALTRHGSASMLDAERLILAPGAYEFVPPFPGWTLPGVLTPGAAQVLVKSQRVAPGSRVVIAGTGPFLLVVACTLVDAGVPVVAVVEAIRPTEVLRELPALLSQPSLLREGWNLRRHLRRAGVRLIAGHVVVRALGEPDLRAVEIAPCDRDWKPDLARTEELAVDTLCVAYGFIPRVQLAAVAGCGLQLDVDRGGWVPVVDDTGRTTLDGVWSVGDGAGVAGAELALRSGTLAGLAVAHDAGVLSATELVRAAQPLRRELAGLKRFRAGLDRLSRIRPGLATLPQDDTLVCRCEELSLAEIREAVVAGNTEYRTLKVATRLGMGSCQGRMCWPGVSRWLAHERQCPLEELGPGSVRSPIDPVTLGELAAWPPDVPVEEPV